LLQAASIDQLLLHVAQTAPSTAFVGLFSTENATKVYASRGFTAGDMAGMFRLVQPVQFRSSTSTNGL